MSLGSTSVAVEYGMDSDPMNLMAPQVSSEAAQNFGVS